MERNTIQVNLCYGQEKWNYFVTVSTEEKQDF